MFQAEQFMNYFKQDEEKKEEGEEEKTAQEEQPQEMRRPRNLSIINEEDLNHELRNSLKKKESSNSDYNELMLQMKRLSEYNSQHNSAVQKNYSSNSLSINVRKKILNLIIEEWNSP